MRRRDALFITLLTVQFAFGAREPQTDPRLKNAFRKPEQNGWTFVHLEGAPAEVGFQHGYLLAPEILEAQKITALELSHDTHKKWAFFRDSARNVLWPHIESEYREELQGIAQGLNAKGMKLDVWDVVALNASLEWSYFVKQFNKRRGIKSPATVTAPEHCSAFAATGSYTKDGKFVIGHNNWTGYLDGERWTVIFDVTPAAGHRFLMDGFPGFIHSADDFSVNASGIVITETTISGFAGWDSNGIPEFVRARKAMQYSSSIDDFARIMKEGNNGGYANDWLIADRKTNEVASLELGLRNVNLQRTKDGYFVGSNFPINPKLAREETDFKVNDLGNSPNARHVRWEQLMTEFKGKIDVDSGKKFLADHVDTFAGKTEPNERTLCGHIDLSPRGVGGWQKPYGPAGAVQNKVTDATLAGEMSFAAAAGHSCGIDFKAAEHLRKHRAFRWEKEYLRDMDSRPWTVFQIAR